MKNVKQVRESGSEDIEFDVLHPTSADRKIQRNAYLLILALGVSFWLGVYFLFN